MSDFTEKVRAMLSSLTTQDWSWSGRTEEPDEDMPGGIFIWHPQGSYLGDTMICLSDTYEDDHNDLDFIAAAPTLLREACERIEALEKVAAVVEAAKFDRKELHHPECKCHFCAAVDSLDAVDAEEK